MNPYEILGADRADDTATIRKRYRQRAKTEHPDAGGDPNSFNTLSRALDLLVDPLRRAKYDKDGTIDEGSTIDRARATALQIIDKTMGEHFNAFIQSEFDPGLDPRATNFVAAISNAIAAQIADFKYGLTKGQKVLKFYQDILSRLEKRKAPQDDPVRRLINNQIDNAGRVTADLKLGVEARQLAVKILADYKFTAAPKQKGEEGHAIGDWPFGKTITGFGPS